MGLLRFWLGLMAGVNCLGWILSAIGQLGAVGYGVGLPPLVLLAWWAARRPQSGPGTSRPLNGIRWARFRRPLPFLFLVLAAGALVGGLLYEPNHSDGLAYRTPRVLNWLAEGRWHWIDTTDARLNVRTLAFEWVTTPFLALTHSDRLVPLISLVSFLFLPGLCFGLLRGFGVRMRVAWWWMWLLPTSYGFALQAGGILNDLFGTVFALAAVVLAFQARRDNDLAAARFSVLAAALMIGSKASNLPLLLPWVVAFCPLIPWLGRRPLGWAAAVLVAILTSNIPISLMNQRHCGDWTGLAAETRARDMIGHGSPGFYLLHNVGLLLSQNLNPPALPVAGALNQWIETVLTPAWRTRLSEAAEDGVHSYRLREMPSEDYAGLGLPLSLAAGAFLVLTIHHGIQWFRRRNGLPVPVGKGRLWTMSLACAPWISVLVFVTQSGILGAARLLLPYYPFLLATLLRGSQADRWVRTLTWRRLALVAGLSTVFVMMMSPMRPLWPQQAFLAHFGVGWGLADRLRTVYTVLGERSHSFDPLLSRLPAGVDRVGMLSQAQFLEGPLWRPYGTHRVIRPSSGVAPEEFRRRGVRYVVLRVADVALLWPAGLSDWLQRGHAEVLARESVPHFAVEIDPDWILVRLGE